MLYKSQFQIPEYHRRMNIPDDAHRQYLESINAAGLGKMIAETIKFTKQEARYDCPGGDIYTMQVIAFSPERFYSFRTRLMETIRLKHGSGSLLEGIAEQLIDELINY